MLHALLAVAVLAAPPAKHDPNNHVVEHCIDVEYIPRCFLEKIESARPPRLMIPPDTFTALRATWVAPLMQLYGDDATVMDERNQEYIKHRNLSVGTYLFTMQVLPQRKTLTVQAFGFGTTSPFRVGASDLQAEFMARKGMISRQDQLSESAWKGFSKQAVCNNGVLGTAMMAGGAGLKGGMELGAKSPNPWVKATLAVGGAAGGMIAGALVATATFCGDEKQPEAPATAVPAKDPVAPAPAPAPTPTTQPSKDPLQDPPAGGTPGGCDPSITSCKQSMPNPDKPSIGTSSPAVDMLFHTGMGAQLILVQSQAEAVYRSLQQRPPSEVQRLSQLIIYIDTPAILKQGSPLTKPVTTPLPVPMGPLPPGAKEPIGSAGIDGNYCKLAPQNCRR